MTSRFAMVEIERSTKPPARTIFQEMVYLDAYFIELAIDQFGAEHFKAVFPAEHLYLGMRRQRVHVPQATHTMADVPGRRLRALVREKMEKLNGSFRRALHYVPEDGNRGTDHGHGSVYWVLGGNVSGGRIVGQQVRIQQATLFQNRDYPVLNEYRPMFAGLFPRMYDLNSAQLDRVFLGVRPNHVALAYLHRISQPRESAGAPPSTPAGDIGARFVQRAQVRGRSRREAIDVSGM